MRLQRRDVTDAQELDASCVSPSDTAAASMPGDKSPEISEEGVSNYLLQYLLQYYIRYQAGPLKPICRLLTIE